MRLTRLIVQNVRNLEAIDWRPRNGLNLLVGPNGGGKTSLLEAIHLAAVGRSFRTRNTDQLVRLGSEGLKVSAWFEHGDGRSQHIRLQRDALGTRIRLDERELRAASELVRSLPVLVLSQDGMMRFRRSRSDRLALVDWGLFHVEHDYHQTWSRYHTALSQRNAALRRRQPSSPWMVTLVDAGELLTRSRIAYVACLQPRVNDLASQLGLDFRPVLSLQKGWREAASLAEYWRESEDRDRGLGYTNGGPHRANLLVKVDHHLGLENLSSGQVKLAYLITRLAQLDALLEARPGADPIIFFDDLAAELDGRHVAAVMQLLADHQLQRFVTAPFRGDILPAQDAAVFHVERGAVTPEVS